MTEYVWYASYGSNISTTRFLCYILGGQAIGAKTCEEGCRNKALPLKYENLEIHKTQYFAKSSYRWHNGGVAFLDNKYSSLPTFGRMYLITKEQFEDVVKQENKIPVTDTLILDLDLIQHVGSKIVIPDSWYGRILYLGSNDGYPIFTFTNVVDYDNEVINKPSEAYIQMIARGLIENYNLDIDQLTDYFIKKSGIQESYSYETLKLLISPLFTTEKEGKIHGR